MQRMRIVFAACLLVLTLSSSVMATASAQHVFTSYRGVVWEQRSFVDPKGETGSYFVTGPSDTGMLVVLIQGSGCVPLFESLDDLDHVASASQDVLAQALGASARLMVVEKPHVAFNARISNQPGTSEGCALAFRERYALDDWVAVLEAAIGAYRQAIRGDIRVAALGFSEGVMAATRLARHGSANMVGVIGAGTCHHQARMIERAIVRGRLGLGGANAEETLQLIEDIEQNVTAIDRFAWGHTYLRWSTFGRACETGFLTQWPGPVFISYGTLDEDLDITGLESLHMARQAHDLPTEIVRVIDGDHGLFAGETDHRPQVFSAFAAYLESVQ